MKPLLLLMAALSLVAASCTTESEPTTATTESTPDEVVSTWLAALEAPNLDGLRATTIPANVALVAGAENGFTVEQMASVVDAGLPGATARSYWTSFRESIGDFLGAGLDDVVVGGSEEFTVDAITYAAVTVVRGEASTEVLTRLSADGWRVDLVATVGPALAVQIRRLVASIVAEADDATARSYAADAEIALGAALVRDPSNRALELELEAIEDLPIDLGG